MMKKSLLITQRESLCRLYSERNKMKHQILVDPSNLDKKLFTLKIIFS